MYTHTHTYTEYVIIYVYRIDNFVTIIEQTTSRVRIKISLNYTQRMNNKHNIRI